ncbi:MAG: hypothetical protein V4597_08380 [Pseudomonadota bacterium]
MDMEAGPSQSVYQLSYVAIQWLSSGYADVPRGACPLHDLVWSELAAAEGLVYGLKICVADRTRSFSNRAPDEPDERHLGAGEQPLALRSVEPFG